MIFNMNEFVKLQGCRKIFWDLKLVKGSLFGLGTSKIRGIFKSSQCGKLSAVKKPTPKLFNSTTHMHLFLHMHGVWICITCMYFMQ